MERMGVRGGNREVNDEIADYKSLVQRIRDEQKAIQQKVEEDNMKNKAEINLTAEMKDGKIRGTAFMGCNRMFFNSEFKSKNKVKISGVGSTLMACQEMELENKFVKAFETMTHYKIEGHFLTLYNEKGNEMKFLAADWD